MGKNLSGTFTVDFVPLPAEKVPAYDQAIQALAAMAIEVSNGEKLSQELSQAAQAENAGGGDRDEQNTGRDSSETTSTEAVPGLSAVGLRMCARLLPVQPGAGSVDAGERGARQDGSRHRDV